MSDGIEKLKELADQIEREHASELQALKERYKTDLREARESRDIAIKEASKLRNDVTLAKDLVPDFTSDIAIMLGISCDGMANEVQKAIEAELDNRLMPQGMEWPKDRNENPFDPRKLYDSGCGAVDSVRIGFVNGKQWARVVSHDGIDLSPEELDDCEPEMLGADGLPIEVAHTQHDTQERIDEDATMPPRRYYAEKIGHDVDLKDDEEVFTAVALSLMSRQRELDARTMGGE